MKKTALLTAALATLISTGLVSNSMAAKKPGKHKDHAKCKGEHGCGEKKAAAPGAPAPAEGEAHAPAEGEAH